MSESDKTTLADMEEDDEDKDGHQTEESEFGQSFFRTVFYSLVTPSVK